MRVVLVCLFVFAGILAAVILLGPLVDHGHSSSLLKGTFLGLGFGLFVVAMAIVALVLLKWYPLPKGRTETTEEYVLRLRDADLLVGTDYRATRAFTIAPFEDVGYRFILELDNGSVLNLCGQYLEDFYDADGTEAWERFPCTEFTILRHRTEGGVIDIECHGQQISTDADLKGKRQRDLDQLPKDGELFSGMTYDELLAAARDAEDDSEYQFL